jgi:hypothetical protein
VKVLVTVSDLRRLAVIIDLESGCRLEIPARPQFFEQIVGDRLPFRPFGVTWSDSSFFFANHRQLLEFDKGLTFVGVQPVRLPANTHQIVYRDSRVWVISPWTNSIIITDGSRCSHELDLLRLTLRPYVPRVGAETNDWRHFNSLRLHRNRLYVAAHCFGARSFIFVVDLTTLSVVRVIADAGSMIHGVALSEGVLYWLSTGTREIRSDSSLRLPLSRPGFARGLAMTKDHYVVAVSEELARSKRHTGHSWIQVIDRYSGAMVEEVLIENSGSVNELRVLDEPDDAHGVPSIWDPAYWPDAGADEDCPDASPRTRPTCRRSGSGVPRPGGPRASR